MAKTVPCLFRKERILQASNFLSEIARQQGPLLLTIRTLLRTRLSQRIFLQCRKSIQPLRASNFFFVVYASWGGLEENSVPGSVSPSSFFPQNPASRSGPPGIGGSLPSEALELPVPRRTHLLILRRAFPRWLLFCPHDGFLVMMTGLFR